MFALLSIEPSGKVGELSEAGVATYTLKVVASGRHATYLAEVRAGPRGDQIDWADEFQDLLLEHDILATDYGKISDHVHQFHCGLAPPLPATFGVA